MNAEIAVVGHELDALIAMEVCSQLELEAYLFSEKSLLHTEQLGITRQIPPMLKDTVVQTQLELGIAGSLDNFVLTRAGIDPYRQHRVIYEFPELIRLKDLESLPITCYVEHDIFSELSKRYHIHDQVIYTRNAVQKLANDYGMVIMTQTTQTGIAMNEQCIRPIVGVTLRNNSQLLTELDLGNDDLENEIVLVGSLGSTISKVGCINKKWHMELTEATKPILDEAESVYSVIEHMAGIKRLDQDRFLPSNVLLFGTAAWCNYMPILSRVNMLVDNLEKIWRIK